MDETPTQRTNKKLRELWLHNLKYFGQGGFKRLWPMQYPERKRCKLLIIGLNPSHPENKSKNPEIIRLYNSLDIQGEAKEDFANPERQRDVVKWEERSSNEYAYFKPFQQYFPDNWYSVDLLAVRITSQNELKKVLKIKNATTALENPFVKEQIKIALKFAEDLSPKSIIVVNALASDLLKKYMGLRDFNSEKGFYSEKLGGEYIPWFLSGMLTGQRALDTHSRDRLIGQVQRALKEVETKI